MRKRRLIERCTRSHHCHRRAKGQGKSWIARQFIQDSSVQAQIPSGVLGEEATTKLHWIGPHPPEDLVPQSEKFLPCDPQSMVPLGQPYMLLDTPGVTDADKFAAEATKRILSLAPIKLLVVRRDQLRSAINSEIAAAIEGAVCLPIITAIPLRELPAESDGSDRNPNSQPLESLDSDLRQLVDWLRASAPNTQFLSSILVEDFEASGKELLAGKKVIATISQRLQSQPLQSLARTRANRLTSIHQKLRRSVSRLIDAETPFLASSVRRLHDEANALPTQAVEGVLGSTTVLHTAIRGRLRAQLITDTSPLWFPYRSLLSLLGFTQGAWDRLVLALSGSVPSIFGTLATWARNMQWSNKASLEMQDGIRERMTRQVTDRLEPIHHQFHRALQRLRDGSDVGAPSETPRVRLGGIEELQERSRAIFEAKMEQCAYPRSLLQLAGLVSTVCFWGMLSGPIVWAYRQYFAASKAALWESTTVAEFPHPAPSMLMTSILLSIIPVFLFAMIFMTILLRRGKILRIASDLQAEHHSLIDKLRNEGVLRLHYEDRSLEQAEFLIHLDRTPSDAATIDA